MGKDKLEASLVSRSLTYAAPLPPANEFSGYEKALPGAADRILKMAEQEAEHRRNNENTVVNESVKISKKGQLFAFIISLLSLIIIGIYKPAEVLEIYEDSTRIHE
jgi:uncharacterized membrane protein